MNAKRGWERRLCQVEEVDRWREWRQKLATMRYLYRLNDLCSAVVLGRVGQNIIEEVIGRAVPIPEGEYPFDT